MRVLILGGTSEGRELARLLVQRPGFEVISSLAGSTTEPVFPDGQVRVGGFGGVAGLTESLQALRIDTLIDATHPFATAISTHAIAAAKTVGCDLIVLNRPGWVAGTGDRWERVANVAAASARVSALPDGVVFLTVGRRYASAFAVDAGHHYLIRSVSAPVGKLPPRHTILLGRGPFDVDAERAILRGHHVDLLVTRDSGGSSGTAKLAAAREENIPVLLIDRPASSPPALAVDTVSEVLKLLAR